MAGPFSGLHLRLSVPLVHITVPEPWQTTPGGGTPEGNGPGIARTMGATNLTHAHKPQGQMSAARMLVRTTDDEAQLSHRRRIANACDPRQ